MAAAAAAAAPSFRVELDGFGWGAALFRGRYLPVAKTHGADTAMLAPAGDATASAEGAPKKVVMSIAGRLREVPDGVAMVTLLPELSSAVQKDDLGAALHGTELHPLTYAICDGVVTGQPGAACPSGWYYLKAAASSHGQDVERVFCDELPGTGPWDLSELLADMVGVDGSTESAASLGTALARSTGVLQREVSSVDPTTGQKFDLRLWAAMTGDGRVWVAPSCIRRMCAGNFVEASRAEDAAQAEARGRGEGPAPRVRAPRACVVSNRMVRGASKRSDGGFFSPSTSLPSTREHVATPPEAAQCARRALLAVREAALRAGTPASPSHHMQVCGLDVAILYGPDGAAAVVGGEAVAGDDAVGFASLGPDHADTVAAVSAMGAAPWPLAGMRGGAVLIECNRGPSLGLHDGPDAGTTWPEAFKPLWLLDLLRWAVVGLGA